MSSLEEKLQALVKAGPFFSHPQVAEVRNPGDVLRFCQLACNF
jgi:hypothetical protein